MYGSLFKNSRGGMLFSENNPVFNRIIVTAAGTGSSTDATAAVVVSAPKGVGTRYVGDIDTARLLATWSVAGVYYFDIPTPRLHYAPMVIINRNSIPKLSRDYTSGNLNPTGIAEGNLHKNIYNDGFSFSADGRSTNDFFKVSTLTNYYSPAGFALLSVSEILTDEAGNTYPSGTRWRIYYMCSNKLESTAFTFAGAFSGSDYVNTATLRGMECYSGSGETIFTTRPKHPFSIQLLKPLKEFTWMHGAPIDGVDGGYYAVYGIAIQGQSGCRVRSVVQYGSSSMAGSVIYPERTGLPTGTTRASYYYVKLITQTKKASLFTAAPTVREICSLGISDRILVGSTGYGVASTTRDLAYSTQQGHFFNSWETNYELGLQAGYRIGIARSYDDTKLCSVPLFDEQQVTSQSTRYDSSGISEFVGVIAAAYGGFFVGGGAIAASAAFASLQNSGISSSINNVSIANKTYDEATNRIIKVTY